MTGNDQLFDSVFQANVEVNENLGSELIVHVMAGDERLKVRLDGNTRIDAGDSIQLSENTTSSFSMRKRKRLCIRKRCSSKGAPFSYLPNLIRPFRVVDKWIAVVLIFFINDFISFPLAVVNLILLIPFEQDRLFAMIRS